MSILSVDTIQPIGSGSTVTLNAAKIVVGTGITFESNGQAIYAGIITATSFSGSGANLTSLPAANLTGTLPAISGANLTNLPAANLTGTLPAISGANLTSLPTQVTIANNADNRVITGGSGVNLNGESTFTHDSTNYDTVISGSANAPMDLIIRNDHNSFTAAGARLTIQSGNEANTGPQEQMIVGSHSWLRQVPKSSGNMTLAKNGTNHTTFAADGDLVISDGDLVIGTAGHGIDFSAAGNAGGMTSEILDDYEEGNYDVSVTGSGGGSIGTQGNINNLRYTKIGRLIHVTGRIYLNTSNNPSGDARMSLPFTAAANTNDQNGQGYSYVTRYNVYNPNSDYNLVFEIEPNVSFGVFLWDRPGAGWTGVNAGSELNQNACYLGFDFTYTTAS